ncbi:MAG TPA: glycoside hydrolase family 43 protein [Longimicrobiaceae bacterium]
MSRSSLSPSALTLAFALALGACAAPPGESPTATADPRFDWFEYSGSDPVFERFPAGPGQYHNPILAGFYPDPSITRVGDDYYIVNSTFTFFPGIPVFHSRDLVNWTQIGNVIDRPSMLDFDSLGISRGVFAPTIEHHEGLFYVLNTCVDCGGNFLVTATDPAGPWSDPVWLREVDGIDPSLFFDDDGKAYILNNGAPIGRPLYDGHRAIWIQEFDPASRRMVGDRTLIVNGGVDISQRPVWIEGPHIYKRNGWYYLSAAEGGTAVDHSQVILRSRNVRGPYEPGPDNPILTQRHLDPARPFPVTSAGHADFVQTPNGDWWTIFLAVRPYREDYHNIGRETFLLPVRWEGEWPSILSGDAVIPHVAPRPDLPAQPAPEVPMSGNFTVREEFDDPELAPYWSFIRTPRERWHELSAGSLTLRARPEHIGRRAQPSFVGRRQQHHWMTASTAMHYRPAAADDRAGLIAFQNDDFYYLLAVTLVEGRPVVRLERAAGAGQGASPTVIATAPVDLDRRGPIHLRIDARGDEYDFYYGYAPDEWIALHTGADGTILSTRSSGGFGGAFVGTMLGLYAYRAP